MWIRKTYSTGEETKFNTRDTKAIIDVMFEAIDNKEITPDEYFEGEYCISDGQTPEDALAEEINTVVKEFANEQIKKGHITYDEDLGEWVIGNDDPKAIKQLLSILEVKVYQEVIKPAKATLKKSQQDALLATFHKTFTNPAHVKDGTPAFKGAKLLLKKTLNGMKESTGATYTFDVNTEALAEAFYKACNTVLTEMYAKRYGVKQEEASQMFILKDTTAA